LYFAKIIVHAHVPKKFKNFNKCQSNKCQGHSLTVEGRSPEKKVLSYGFCPNEGGGGPCPNFLAHIQEVHFWPIKESIK